MLLITSKFSQIAGADVILINKSDLVEPADLDELGSLVEKVNPAASIYRTTRGSIDLKLMMGIEAYSSRKVLTPTPLTLHTHSETCGPDHSHGDCCNHGCHGYLIRRASCEELARMA